MKILSLLSVALFLATSFSYSQNVRIDPIYPGGGSSGGGAGSITNLSASVGSLYNATAKNVDVTNTTRLLTNVFDTTFGTNVAAVTSATNGWIQITNDGVYVLSLLVNYKVSVVSSIPRTNVWAITTNAAVVGTNIAAQVLTTPNTNVNVFNFAGVEHVTFLASNTFISAGVYNTINIANTNSNSVDRVYLSAKLLPGSPFGSSVSGSGVTVGSKQDIQVVGADSDWQINPGVVGVTEVGANVLTNFNAANVSVGGAFTIIGGNLTNNGDAYLINGLTRIYGAGGDGLRVSRAIHTLDLVVTNAPLFLAGIGSTNSFDTNKTLLYSKTLIQGENEFWDDFDGPTMRFGEFLTRRSPSGHTYRLHSTDPQGTNGFLMIGGRLTQTNHLDTPFYLSVSNDAPSFVKPWNKFGAIITWRSNLPPTINLGEFGLINISHAILGGHSGDYLHTYTDINGTPVVQRSLTENILSEDNGLGALGSGTYHNGRRIKYEINVFSNSMTLQIGGYFATAYHTNLAAFTRWPVIMWELFGAGGTNEVQPEIESIYAGYADPAMEILARSPRKIGTNGTEITQITIGTLVAGTYTNKFEDEIVAIGDGTVRTNKLSSQPNSFGKSVTIIDTALTATGTNVIVEDIAGVLIYPGAFTRTNISINGGSIKLIRTTAGWQVDNRPTLISGGGAGNPAGVTTSVQFNTAGAFDGNTNLTWSATTNILKIQGDGAIGRPGINIINDTLGWTNKIDHTSIRVSQILRFAGGGINSTDDDWIIDQNGNLSFVANAASSGTIYSKVASAMVFSNVFQTIPSNSGTMTIYGTNQLYEALLVGNITFADNALIPNIWYRVEGSNNASTITWPATYKWWDGPTETSAPLFQATKFAFEVKVNSFGTNARVVSERQLVLVATNNVEFSTNTTTGVITAGVRSIVTNLANVQFALHRNSTVTLSNLVLSLSTNTHEIIGWTNAVFTNVVTVSDTTAINTKVYIRPSGVNMTLVYPPFDTATNGYFWRTNINSPMWTTATNGVTYVLSLSTIGTNIFSTLTPWP